MPALSTACHHDSLSRADLIIKYRLMALRQVHDRLRLLRDRYRDLLQPEVHGIAMEALLIAVETYDHSTPFPSWLKWQVLGQVRNTVRQIFRQVGGKPDNEGKPKQSLTLNYDPESFFGMVNKRSTNGVPGHDFAKLTRMLSPRKREMLTLRFVHDMSTQDIADKFKISQDQVWITLRQTYKELKSLDCFQRFAADSGRTCYRNS